MRNKTVTKNLPTSLFYALHTLAGAKYLATGPGCNGLRGIKGPTMRALETRGWVKCEFTAITNTTTYTITKEGLERYWLETGLIRKPGFTPRAEG